MNDSNPYHDRSTNPGTQEGHDTTDRLLAVGRRLFAQGGFKGTSIRALTADAGANLGAVTYHFESKEAFYQAVLDQVMGPLRERVGALAESDMPAPDRLEIFVRGMFQHLRENPDLPRFFVQEIVIGDDPSPQLLRTVKTVVGTLATVFRQGQEEGTVIPGDPVLMALTLLSQPIYLTLMPRFLAREDLKDAGLPRPEGSAEEHVLGVLHRAFLAPEEGIE
jgi:AcrR family transcriptional regulator